MGATQERGVPNKGNEQQKEGTVKGAVHFMRRAGPEGKRVKLKRAHMPCKRTLPASTVKVMGTSEF